MIKLVPAVATVLALAVLVPAPADASAQRGSVPHLGVLSPTGGPTSGGNVVTIRGHHLGRVTAVTFGSARATKLRHLSPSRITVQAPSEGRGRVRVRLVSNGEHAAEELSYRFGPAAPLRSVRRTEIDPSGGVIGDLSCPTDDFCAGVNGHALAVIRAGHEPTTTPAQGGLVVSCGTPTFCVAQRDHTARFWDGTSWSASTQLGSGVSVGPLSCAPGTTTCLGTGYERAVFYQGTTFSVVDPPQSPLPLSVSCATSTFCMTFNSDDSFSFDGSTWTEHGQPDGFDGVLANLGSISCPTTDFCLATDAYADQTSRWDGSTWHQVTGSRFGVGPACRGADDCVSLDLNSNHAKFFASGSYGAKQAVPAAGSFVSVACAPLGKCFATDDRGQLFSESDGAWSDGTQLTRPAGQLQDISCGSDTWCVAVDVEGNAMVGGTQGWQSPQPIDELRSLTAVSCTTQHLCAAVDDDGYAVIYRNGTWSAPTDIDGSRHLRDVACAGSNRCVAIDNKGDAVTWDGTEWTVPLRIAHGLRSVSCASEQMCAAVGPGGMRVLDRGNWSKARPPLHTRLQDIDCLRDDYCVAADDRGFAVWHHRLWGAPTVVVDTSRYPLAISCSSDLVCLGTASGGSGYHMFSIAGASWRGVDAPTSSHISCVAGGTCFLITRQAVTTVRK